MNTQKVRIYSITVALFTFLVACTNSQSGPSESVILTAMAETSAAFPTATISPTLEPTQIQNPTNTSTPEFVTRAFVSSPTLNLRTGPSMLYNLLDTYQQGEEVFAVGRVKDGKWLKIEAKRRDGSGRVITGWMFTEYLDLRSSINLLPIITLPDNQTIIGTVKDDAGNPLNSIRVSAFYEPDDSAQIFAYDTTGSDGEFTIYVPENVIGELDVQITFVNCDSLIMNDDCLIHDYFPLIWRVFVQAPYTDPINLVYEKAIVLLEGKVVYQDGWGVPNVWVTATRESDDVEQKVFTEIGGKFYFPLGEGVWEILATRVDQEGITRYSNPEIYTITKSSEQPEYLKIPVPSNN